MNRKILRWGINRPQAVKARIGELYDQCLRRVLLHKRVGERLIPLYDDSEAIRGLNGHNVVDHPFRRYQFRGGWMIGCAPLQEHHQESQQARHCHAVGG
jgi:hypothetical protein